MDDAQLSHVDPNKVRATYNHAEYVEQRRRMMQDWADRLDLLEQDQLEAASMPLTVYLEGMAGAFGGPDAAAPPAHPVMTPILVVAKAGGADEMEGLFEPLRRGAMRRPGHERTHLGLGLFIVRQIAKVHHGEVGGHSSSNRVRFTMTLPKSPSSSPAGHDDPGPPPA